MNYTTILAQMEAGLRRCQRRIAMAVFLVRLREATETFAVILASVGGASLILRLATGSVPGLNHILIVTAVAAALVFGLGLWRALAARPIDFGCAAERLDLSQSTHNRIATAVALLRTGDDSEFARAAICAGVACLERRQAERPFLDTLQTPWRRTGGFILLGLVLLLITALVERGPDPGGSGVGPGSAMEPITVRLTGGTTDLQTKPKTDDAVPEQEPVVGNNPDYAPVDDSGEGDLPKLGLDKPSAGAAGQRAAGNARRSQTTSDSRSAGSATSGGGAKMNPESKGSKPKRKSSMSSKPAAKEKEGKRSQKGGSINASGSAGAGAMKASESDWSSEVDAKSGGQDDSVDEDEPDEEADGEKQRLGMQPGLKNRTSRVSRELSLSMGKGDDNSTTKGRGGPSPQKKSRGTTTMILGVPIPGFVRGRLLPGSTKSTQEEAEPSSRQSNYTTVVSIESSDPHEEYQERYRPSVADSAQASQYLIDCHGKIENETNKEKGSDTNE